VRHIVSHPFDIRTNALHEFQKFLKRAKVQMPSQIQQEFILHFGEMGSRWGINRTVGQIYALLFLSETPLCADDIVAALHVSRSNVSMSLKELQSWNLVRLRHLPDDRRDYFETPEDMWEIVRILIAERKKREIDPTLTKLRELELAAPEGVDTYALRRMSELRELIETMTAFYDEMNRLETEKLVALLKTGQKLRKMIASTGSVVSFMTPRKKKG
jgi:DNA-binding transcriptional regulator GbsR (MarR family)